MEKDLSKVAGVAEGTILAGKYRIEKVLGAGAMGIVVAARHMQLDQLVAIKFLLPEALHFPNAVGRFAREAQAASRIRSEHVARVTDVGTLDTGAPYLVMEYLDGQDLAGMIAARGRLPVEEVVELLLQACEALAEAHAIGIVHRDLKPANLFCVRRSDGVPSIKVLDFGISKIAEGADGSSQDMRLTGTMNVLGSPYYMSPEQLISAKGVDARTDIWAIGVILYELLSGRTPFNGETFPDLCIKISSQPPLSLSDVRPDLPQDLLRVIATCLEKNRNHRYSNVAELAAALAPYGPPRARSSAERAQRIIEAAGIAVRPSTSFARMTVAADGSWPTATAASWSGTGRAAARPAAQKKRLLALAGVALVAAVAVGTLRHVMQPAPAAPSSPSASTLASPIPANPVPTSVVEGAVAPHNFEGLLTDAGPATVVASPGPATSSDVSPPAAPLERPGAHVRGGTHQPVSPGVAKPRSTASASAPSQPTPEPQPAPTHSNENADPFGGRR